MATTQQTHLIAGRMVEFQNKFFGASNDEAQFIIQNTGEAIELAIKAVREHLETKGSGLLSGVIFEIAVPATTEEFVVAENFNVDNGKKAKVRIAFFNSSFVSLFGTKVEGPFNGSHLAVREVNADAHSSTILKELGGEKKAEVTLTEIYFLMTGMPDEEIETFLCNGQKIIFRARDVNGELAIVQMHWGEDGWELFAYSSEHDLSIGCRIASHSYPDKKIS